MKTLEQQLADAEAAEVVARTIRNQLSAAVRKQNDAKKVGKSFRFLNSSSPDCRWWMYFTVTEQDADGYLWGVTIQAVKNGAIMFERERMYDSIISNSEEVTGQQFSAYANSLLKEAKQLLP